MSNAIPRSKTLTNSTERGTRALIVTNVLKYAIHHRLHLFRRLVDEGYDVVLAGSGSEHEKRQLEDLGIEVRLCAVVPYRFSPLNDLALFPVICRLIRETRPDVLHLFTLKPILFGKLAAACHSRKTRPAALLLSLTGLGRLFLPEATAVQRAVRSMFLGVINRPLKGTSQLLTVETESDKDELTTMSRVRDDDIIVTNGTGVDFDAFSTAKRSGPITFLFAGRLLKSKGVLSYLEAAKIVGRDNSNTRFLIAGAIEQDDPDSVSATLMNELKQQQNCTFLGEVEAEAMPELFRKTDVVCLPTRYKEGIPRSLLEAAASGCAFIACRTPGWIETMGTDTSAGWYVEPSDVDSLVVAMRTAAENPKQTRNAGEIARRAILTSKVSCREVQNRYLDAYHQAEQAGHSKRTMLRKRRLYSHLRLGETAEQGRI